MKVAIIIMFVAGVASAAIVKRDSPSIGFCFADLSVQDLRRLLGCSVVGLSRNTKLDLIFDRPVAALLEVVLLGASFAACCPHLTQADSTKSPAQVALTDQLAAPAARHRSLKYADLWDHLAPGHVNRIEDPAATQKKEHSRLPFKSKKTTDNAADINRIKDPNAPHDPAMAPRYGHVAYRGHD
ncbi:hypothetical protein CLAFUW4_04202 [Fulvia fulva]|nr:hypothetical protein CLAFUR4_04188 [Fulvia fulva]WPV14302.1 hypothetical protein CLAFUW4_04202 [Fulvia fulva]WPV28053.1 hypothetical protein CLAFUW7_04191 [Fulvia fulva]